MDQHENAERARGRVCRLSAIMVNWCGRLATGHKQTCIACCQLVAKPAVLLQLVFYLNVILVPRKQYQPQLQVFHQ